MWAHFHGWGQVSVTGFCEQANKLSGYIKAGNILHYVTTTQKGLCFMKLIMLNNYTYLCNYLTLSAPVVINGTTCINI